MNTAKRLSGNRLGVRERVEESIGHDCVLQNDVGEDLGDMTLSATERSELLQRRGLRLEYATLG